MRTISISLCLVALGSLWLFQTACAKVEEVSGSSLPAADTQSVKTKFPRGEITEAARELEDNEAVYAVTITNDGEEAVVNVQPDGSILEVEDADHAGVEDDDDQQVNDQEWTRAFSVEKDDLMSTGRNPFFILEPGYQLVLEGGQERLVITVLNETKSVEGVTTRVVEERETERGQLVEVSRNFFAISKRTSAVFYFGEEVDIYKDGQIVKHEGAWLAGEENARFGLIMPGLPLLGARYYQELAEGKAMDRAEIKGIDEDRKTPAGTFKNCLKTEETTPLEPAAREYKYYAPGVGLIQEESLKLVRFGQVELPINE